MAWLHTFARWPLALDPDPSNIESHSSRVIATSGSKQTQPPEGRAPSPLQSLGETPQHAHELPCALASSSAALLCRYHCPRACRKGSPHPASTRACAIKSSTLAAAGRSCRDTPWSFGRLSCGDWHGLESSRTCLVFFFFSTVQQEKRPWAIAAPTNSPAQKPTARPKKHLSRSSTGSSRQPLL